jgi:hypothetical protein
MTVDQLRSIRLAEWHARESICRASVGEYQAAEHHYLAARESLRNSGQIFVATFYTADDIASICADIKDDAGIVA